jgi:energy-coupling factor transporter ATP-binding protein EcfA2
LAAGADPRVLGEALLAEFPWMREAVDAVVGDLELRRAAGSAHAHFRPILLLGPPGCGKSRFARKLAELLGVGHGEVNAGGSSDNRLVAGTARGWSSASPAYVLHVMRDTGCANPLVFVDEIDKAAHGSHNGDVRATLLTMIGNAGWPDECLMAKTDLSQVNWILAANDAQPLRGPLLTRLRVVGVPNPGPEHADAVLASIGRDVTRELGLPQGSMPELSPHAEAALKDAFAKGHSVRRVRAAYEGALRAGGMMGSLRTVN